MEGLILGLSVVKVLGATVNKRAIRDIFFMYAAARGATVLVMVYETEGERALLGRSIGRQAQFYETHRRWRCYQFRAA